MGTDVTRTTRRGVPSRAAALGVLGVLGLLGALLTACTPPPAVPVCPTRTEVSLELPSRVDFSLPRAVSPDGTWLALSRVVDGEVVISARKADPLAPSKRLGTIPYGEVVSQPPRVAVAAAGARVLWAGSQFAPLPDAPTSTLYRWVRSADTTEAVTPPVTVSPPVGTPYPVNLRLLSADGSRAVWTQAFFDGAGFRFVRSVTDTATDAVLDQREFTDVPSGTPSSGARNVTLTWVPAGGEYAVVDLVTNASTSLTPALAAAQAAYPGGAFRPQVSSDSGRFTVLQRPFETPATYVLWDEDTDTVALIVQRGGVTVDTVDDTGTVVYSLDNGTTVRSVHRSVDGTTRTVAAAPMLATWPAGMPVRPLTSVDRRTTVYSEPVPLLGNRLVARRCV